MFLPEPLEERLARPSGLHVELEVRHEVYVADDGSVGHHHVSPARNKVPHLGMAAVHQCTHINVKRSMHSFDHVLRPTDSDYRTTFTSCLVYTHCLNQHMNMNGKIACEA